MSYRKLYYSISKDSISKEKKENLFFDFDDPSWKLYPTETEINLNFISLFSFDKVFQCMNQIIQEMKTEMDGIKVFKLYQTGSFYLFLMKEMNPDEICFIRYH